MRGRKMQTIGNYNNSRINKYQNLNENLNYFNIINIVGKANGKNNEFIFIIVSV